MIIPGERPQSIVLPYVLYSARVGTNGAIPNYTLQANSYWA